jgi:hypothetical protein
LPDGGFGPRMRLGCKNIEERAKPDNVSTHRRGVFENKAIDTISQLFRLHYFKNKNFKKTLPSYHARGSRCRHAFRGLMQVSIRIFTIK